MVQVAVMTDQDGLLVQRCQANDLSAFDEIVARYQNRIYHFVRRMVGNDTVAEDITQDVFLKAFRNISAFRQESSLQTWLFRIASNLCRDNYRRKQRETAWFSFWRKSPNDDESSEEIELPDVSHAPERNYMQAELGDMIQNAIQQLSPVLREAIILHEIEEMPYEEVAQTLGVPLGTVKSRIFHGRSRLRKVLETYLQDMAANG